MVGFVAIVAVVVCCFQIAPPLLSNYSFQDDLRNVAMLAGANPHETDEDIRNDVVRKAKDRGLPIEAKQVTIERINTPGSPGAYVAADYSVTVNLPGYSFDMHFSPSSGNRGF